MEPHNYNVHIAWKEDRKGLMTSPELNTTIEVATPPQFPKGMAGIWSPEHLFTAAVGSCLMTTFLAIAENSKLDFDIFDVRSKGVLEQVDGKWMVTRVELYPQLVIRHEKDRERAQRVLQKSEAACLISNSVKSQVVMQPNIEIAQQVLA